jgi:GntR family transcriptional regulator
MPRGSPIPLYYQVLQVVRERIASRHYPPTGQLPTDEALTREFQVSRHTVRAAMDKLVADGLIERFAGRGTFVTQRSRPHTQWTIESIEDLIDTSFADTFTVLSARFVKPQTVPSVSTLFQADRPEVLFHVRAIRSSEEGPYSYSNLFFPRDIGEKLPQERFTERPLLLLAEEYAGVVATQARQVVSAQHADRETADLLRIRFGEPVLVMERTYFDDDGRAIEHTLIQYRPDRYQQTVVFSRREGISLSGSYVHRRPGNPGS